MVAGAVREQRWKGGYLVVLTVLGPMGCRNPCDWVAGGGIWSG